MATDDWLHINRGDELTEDEDRKAAACIDEAMKLLAKLCKGYKAHEREKLFELCQSVYRLGQKVGERKKWFDRLEADVFAKMNRDDPLPHAVTGSFLIEYAWDARGSGTANTVTPDGWKKFKEHLAEAERRLTRDWELDKELALSHANMVVVCTGLGHGRDAMEKWVARTLEADPTNVQALQMKMGYLSPQWHGKPNETLVFARQLIQLKNWDSGQPILALLAHVGMAAVDGNAFNYFRDKPEVWNEVEPILAEILRRYPKSSLGASVYFYFSWLSDQNAVRTRDYLKAVEDSGIKLVRGVFKSEDEMDLAKSWLSQSLEKAEK